MLNTAVRFAKSMTPFIRLIASLALTGKSVEQMKGMTGKSVTDLKKMNSKELDAFTRDMEKDLQRGIGWIELSLPAPPPTDR